VRRRSGLWQPARSHRCMRPSMRNGRFFAQPLATG
jgi:hypothetical protein